MVPTLRLMVLSMVLAVTVNSLAQPTWKRVYGGFDVDMAFDAVATDDGGVVVVGSTGSFGFGSSDVYLFKVDEFGVRQWSTTLGTAAVETGEAIALMDDGGFLIAGSTNATPSGDYDGMVIRADADGAVLWQRTYGGGDWDFLYAIDATPDGGALVAGMTYSWAPAGEAWVLRLDAQGDTLWTFRTGGPGYADARSVKFTPDGGGILAGVTTDAEGDKDALVVKFNADATIQWSNTYGGDSLDLARDVILTNEGDYSILGSSKSFGPVTEQYHFRVDPSGDLVWQWSWGQISDQEGYQHIQLGNGDYAAIGYVTEGGSGGKDMFLLISGFDGFFFLGQAQGGVQDDIGHAILRMDGGFLMCGITESYGAGMWDVFLVRTNEIGFTDSDQVISSFDPLSIQDPLHIPTTLEVFPNPSDGTFHLGVDQPVQHVKVLDAAGRIVGTPALSPGERTVRTTLPNGSYIVEVLLQDGTLRRARILIVRS